PDNTDAADQLIPLYRELAEWRKLPAVYDIAIAHAGDAARKRAMMLEIAKIQEENLNNREKAFFWHVEAFKENFEDRDIRGELERLAEPTNNYDIYVAVLEEGVQRISSRSDKTEVFIRIGQIYSEKLDQTENALNAFREALAIEDTNRDALNAVEGIYRTTGRYGELVEALRKKLEIERRDEFRKEVLFDIGCTLRDHLAQNEQAVAIFNEMLGLYPSVERVYDELAVIYSSGRDFGLLRELVRREIEAFAGSADTKRTLLCELHARLGMLEYGAGGGAAAAVSLYENALQLNPDYELAAGLLEELLGLGDIRGRIIPVLKRFYIHRGEVVKLADIVE
ncbi:MAG: hypothetical protein FJ088_17100, partial [Deltaproteobacteria bacterium]|nr:hypothetical protein [Deltaproteobacteria bacterium]